jgi:hypothetical protein
MTDRVCGRSGTGTSTVILTSSMSENGTESTDEGNNDSLSSKLIGHCIGRLDGLSCELV